MNANDQWEIRRIRRLYPIHKRNLGVFIIQVRERNKIITDIPEILNTILTLEDLIDIITDDDDDNDNDNDDINFLNNMLDLLYDLLQTNVTRLMDLSIVVDRGTDIIPPPITQLNNMSDQACTEMFRFSQEKLHELIGNLDPLLGRFNGLLKLPRVFRMNNGMTAPGDIGFLLYVSRQVKWDRFTDCEKITGREYSSNSRIYGAVSQWLYDEWSWRIKDNRQFEEFWVPKFELHNLRFRERYHRLFGTPPPARYANVAFVYDATFYQICKPVDPVMEHLTYSTYEKQNGVKVASATSFCGNTMKLDSVVGGRHNDNFLLNQGGLNTSLQIAQIIEIIQYGGYVDKAYFDKSHIKASYNNRSWNMQEWMHVMNTNMKRACLASVEWKFERINNFFGAIKDKRRLKLLESPIEQYITNAFFLDNLLVMAQGCNANQSFNLDSPSLEEYLTYHY